METGADGTTGARYQAAKVLPQTTGKTAPSIRSGGKAKALVTSQNTGTTHDGETWHDGDAQRLPLVGSVNGGARSVFFQREGGAREGSPAESAPTE